jgi:hypothetical protein
VIQDLVEIQQDNVILMVLGLYLYLVDLVQVFFHFLFLIFMFYSLIFKTLGSNYCNPNPCNLGSCFGVNLGYGCDCSNTGYSGTNCSIR